TPGTHFHTGAGTHQPPEPGKSSTPRGPGDRRHADQPHRPHDQYGQGHEVTRTPTPIKTLSGIYPVRFRADLPRDVADEYWAGPHAELVKRGGHIFEYNQYHFSDRDHGYWPASATVGTYPMDLFRWDGVTEVRLRNFTEMARAAHGMLGTIF